MLNTYNRKLKVRKGFESIEQREVKLERRGEKEMASTMREGDRWTQKKSAPVAYQWHTVKPNKR